MLNFLVKQRVMVFEFVPIFREYGCKYDLSEFLAAFLVNKKK